MWQDVEGCRAGGILYGPGSVKYLRFRITSFTIKLKLSQLRLVSLGILFQISNEHHHPLRTHGSPPRDMRQNPSICIIKLITLVINFTGLFVLGSGWKQKDQMPISFKPPPPPPPHLLRVKIRCITPLSKLISLPPYGSLIY